MQEKSGVSLVAHEKFAQPREVEVSLSFPHLIWLSHECTRAHTHIYICMHCNSLDDHNLLYQKLIITPVKKELGLAFKGNQKMVVEALEVFIVCTLLFVIADTHILSLSLSLQFPNFGGMGLAI